MEINNECKKLFGKNMGNNKLLEFDDKMMNSNDLMEKNLEDNNNLKTEE